MVGAAFRHQAEHLALARRDALERVGPALGLEQARHALGTQHAVVGEEYAHGVCARIRFPSAGGLTTSRRPSTIVRRSARPRSPLPASGWAPPMPSSRTSITACPFWRCTDTLAWCAPAYLATFVSDSATTK